MAAYDYVTANQEDYPRTVLCDVVGASISAYHAARSRLLSRRAQEDAALTCAAIATVAACDPRLSAVREGRELHVLQPAADCAVLRCSCRVCGILKEVTMHPNAIAVARFSIDDYVSARNLYRLIALVHDLYSWHVLMDRLDGGPIDSPAAFFPSHDEELSVNRVEIGTPNFIEVLGLAQPIIDSLAWLTSVGGVALTTVDVVKGYYEIRRTRAEVLNLERELERARQEDLLVQKPVAESVAQPNLLIRTQRHRASFSNEEFKSKESYLKYAEDLAIQLLGPFSSDVKITVFEYGDGVEL